MRINEQSLFIDNDWV